MKADNIALDVKFFCYRGPWAEVEIIATAMQCNMAEGRDPQEIRMELFSKAQRNPAKFLKDKDDPKNARLYTVMQAVNKGILLVDENKDHEKTLKWADGAILCMAPPSIDVIGHFVSKSYTDKAGETTFGFIQEKLDNIHATARHIEDDPKYAINSTATSGSEDDSPESILKDGLDSGVLDQNEFNIFMTGSPRKWKKTGFLQELKSNAKLKAELKGLIEAKTVTKT